MRKSDRIINKQWYRLYKRIKLEMKLGREAAEYGVQPNNVNQRDTTTKTTHRRF